MDARFRNGCILFGGFVILVCSLFPLPMGAAVESNQHGKYFHETTAIFDSNVLETRTKTTLVQCVLRCEGNKMCGRVGFHDDKSCLLLGQTGNGVQVDQTTAGIKMFAPVSIMGTSKCFGTKKPAEICKIC